EYMLSLRGRAFFWTIVALCAPVGAAAFASQATAPPPTVPGYVGSAACQRCHDTEYASWRKTLHVQMTRPVAEALVEGAFGEDRPGERGRGPASPVRF